MSTRFLIIGGGPGGTQAASTAASLGASVTLVEKDIVGGAAHLWDCIPSKTMTATAIRIGSIRNASRLGLVADPGKVDVRELATRIQGISHDITTSWRGLLSSQRVQLHGGLGRFTGPHSAVVTAEDGTEQEVEFDHALISTGSAPRIPSWAEVDGKRILTTRHAYD
ncbi:MAG TPA: FAD-dependent oxidoreductase, partial [Acidimicrobiia bacterium]|nr:FAD-dependent oxidoreductase [Acidimicrobiia bacterium]